MTTPLHEEHLAAAWTSIEKAVQEGLQQAGDPDKQPLVDIVTVTKGSDNLATLVRYSVQPVAPAAAPSSPTVGKLVPTLEGVYELRFTTSVGRATCFDADATLDTVCAAQLHLWGKSIRSEERNWVLETLVNGCGPGAVLTPSDPLLAIDGAARVIPFIGTDASHLAKWPVRAIITLAKPVPLPVGQPPLAAIVIPITGGPSVVRLEDVVLLHSINATNIIVEARLRYRLIGFAVPGGTVGTKYTTVPPPPP